MGFWMRCSTILMLRGAKPPCIYDGTYARWAAVCLETGHVRV